jgi:D-methionine transport system ATP-binding protein
MHLILHSVPATPASPAHLSTQPPEPPLIRIEQVTTASRPVLRDVTLHVARGDICGIAGGSGAGKSTLLRVVNLLERPASGTVVVSGRDLTRLPERDLRAARQNIGTVFARPNLLKNLDVFDNVALPLRLHGTLNAPRLRRRVLDCLDFAGIGAAAGAYPARLDADRKQRVAIARALASQPEILLCDDPTSTLDPEAARSLFDLLRAARTALGVTIVVASHELPALAVLCNRVAVLADGAVAETFDPADTAGGPRVTALGRELAFHGAERAAPFHQGALHA